MTNTIYNLLSLTIFSPTHYLHENIKHNLQCFCFIIFVSNSTLSQKRQRQSTLEFGCICLLLISMFTFSGTFVLGHIFLPATAFSRNSIPFLTFRNIVRQNENGAQQEPQYSFSIQLTNLPEQQKGTKVTENYAGTANSFVLLDKQRFTAKILNLYLP